jgi:acyl-CoA thioesterase
MHLLDKDTAGRPSAEPPGSLVSVSSNWSINELPNGGYMMALLANSLLQESTKKKIAVLTATFIARSVPGDALVLVERIAASSQFERYEARLIQNQTENIRALGTFVDEDMVCTVNRHESDAPAVAPLDECIPIPQMNHFTLYDQVEVRLDPACAGWLNNLHAEKSEFKGWIRFRDERPYDALSLLVVADAFPPPVYASQGLAAWVPTLEMSVNLRKLPSSAWLKCIFRTRFVTCGLAEEDGEVWDATGELVALSRQIAHYRPFT